jgi:hypothetical protein
MTLLSVPADIMEWEIISPMLVFLSKMFILNLITGDESDNFRLRDILQTTGKCSLLPKATPKGKGSKLKETKKKPWQSNAN